MFRKLVVFGVLALVALLPASAASQASPRWLELEVRDGPARSNADPVRIAIPVPDQSASSVQTRIGPARYRVTVQRERRERPDSPLRFEIQRSDPRHDGTRDVSLSVSVVVRPGHRATLARFDRPDGTRTELTARIVASGPSPSGNSAASSAGS